MQSRASNHADGYQAVERLPFATTKWIESRHRKRMTYTAALSKDKVSQLREMFDRLDTDKSGEIEVQEVANAMKYLEAQLSDKNLFDCDQVLRAFEENDRDGSGTLDFDEFLEIMTSDVRGKQYASLQDERKADEDKQNIFFEFATIYRREMLREKLQCARQGTMSDLSGYSAFFEMFDIQLVADKLTEDAEKRRFADHRRAIRKQRKQYTHRASLAARHLLHQKPAKEQSTALIQHASALKYPRPVTASAVLRGKSQQAEKLPINCEDLKNPYAWLSSARQHPAHPTPALKKHSDSSLQRQKKLQSITVPLTASEMRQRRSRMWRNRYISDTLTQRPSSTRPITR